jgi:hypothetical protein
VITFTVPPSRLFRRDVYIAPVPLPLAGAADTADRFGPGSVRGRVVRQGGAAVEGARVRHSETGATVTTNANGYFALDSLTLGSATLDVRAIGFLPVMRPVDVLADAPATADFQLESRAAYLDTVRVRAERLYDPSYEQFLANRRRGFGYFIDEDEIERRNPVYVADLLRMTPGVTVFPGGFGGAVRMRASSFERAYCTPAVFLNGMLLSGIEDFGLDAAVSPEEIRAMEVYSRTAGMPIQYQTMNGCGSIVIWTGTRRKRALPP